MDNRPRRRDERGLSVSALGSVLVMALFLVAGLVIDGGARARAHRRAEVAAAVAVRQGSDASAADRLVGRDGTGAALGAARQALADEGVEGEASLSAGVITVTTRAESETTFLSLLGIDRLEATGSASGELRRPRP
ncbi:pilus assembly protein TadE [Luteococcus peritonei]|uniref:Pilus assembly protein TadE n=1 Tax=Luteococcus peritonei TaxID=88874 RepID=A0ABW4RXN6_9ACTN